MEVIRHEDSGWWRRLVEEIAELKRRDAERQEHMMRLERRLIEMGGKWDALNAAYGNAQNDLEAMRGSVGADISSTPNVFAAQRFTGRGS